MKEINKEMVEISTLILNEIAKTSSKNEKIEQLKKVLMMPDVGDFFKNVLVRAYNPKLMYFLKPFNINNSKFNKEQIKNNKELKYSSMFDLLDDLNSKKITGDAARIAYASYILNNDELSNDLLNKILKKDLRAGFSAGSINKVHKKLIPEIPYMRCSVISDITDIDAWVNPTNDIISQEKLDGMFINLNVNSDSSIEMFTRTGTDITLQSGFFDEIIDIVSKFDKEHQYHGELLVIEKSNNKVLPRAIGNGMLNKIAKNAIKNGKDCSSLFDNEQYKIIISLWDKIPMELLNVEKAEKSELNKPYIERFLSLEKDIKGNTNEIANCIRTTETIFYKNIFDAQEHFERMLKEGKEGTVLKLSTSKWKDGTPTSQIKLKNEFVVELEVKELLDGNGKNKDLFGSLLCVSSDGMLKVAVSGFGDAKRKEIFENKNEYVGSIISVKANCIQFSTTKDGVNSLFLPRFCEDRLDKEEADSMEKIIKQYENSVNIQDQIDIIRQKKIDKMNKKNEKKQQMKMKL